MSERSLGALAQRPVVEPADDPLTHDRPIVAVVDRLNDPPTLAAAIASALGLRGARVASVKVVTRAAEGESSDAGVVRASPDRMRDALARALSTLPPHDVVVLEGPAAVALTRARVAILLAPPSPLALPPDVRAVRSRFELVLHEQRDGVIAALAATLAG